jgi:hypothetical protein
MIFPLYYGDENMAAVLRVPDAFSNYATKIAHWQNVDLESEPVSDNDQYLMQMKLIVKAMVAMGSLALFKSNKSEELLKEKLPERAKNMIAAGAFCVKKFFPDASIDEQTDIVDRCFKAASVVLIAKDLGADTRLIRSAL